MTEFARRQSLGEEARDEAYARLIRSRSVSVLRAINSAIPGTSLTYKTAISVPYGKDLKPGYLLRSEPILSNLSINRQPPHSNTGRKIHAIHREVLTQAVFSMTTSERSLILSGTIINTLTNPLTTRAVGGGIAYLEPTILRVTTRPPEIFSAVTEYLGKLEMIDQDQQETAHTILKKQLPRLF